MASAAARREKAGLGHGSISTPEVGGGAAAGAADEVEVAVAAGGGAAGEGAEAPCGKPWPCCSAHRCTRAHVHARTPYSPASHHTSNRACTKAKGSERGADPHLSRVSAQVLINDTALLRVVDFNMEHSDNLSWLSSGPPSPYPALLLRPFPLVVTPPFARLPQLLTVALPQRSILPLPSRLPRPSLFSPFLPDLPERGRPGGSRRCISAHRVYKAAPAPATCSARRWAVHRCGGSCHRGSCSRASGGGRGHGSRRRRSGCHHQRGGAAGGKDGGRGGSGVGSRGGGHALWQ